MKVIIMKIKRQQGVTLVEILLVLVIISAIIWSAVRFMQERTLQTRMDKMATQMQQILNAALAYYLANQSSWPPSLACLQGQGGCTAAYLPPSLSTTPFGGTYTVTNNKQLFFVYTSITTAAATGTASAVASSVAGLLPLSYTTSTGGSPPPSSVGGGAACNASSTTCNIVASVNVPGQALNTASAVNFAGMYKHGGCVPVPSCPADANGNKMTPTVIVVPVSVSGFNDPNSLQAYPISSFSGYFTGPAVDPPPACNFYGSAVPCGAAVAPASGQYWRACLDVVTEKGDVALSNTTSPPDILTWGNNVSLMAITRCKPNGEASGSPSTVYSR